MKRRIPIRILSLFLALVLVLPNFQPAFAQETVDVTEPTSAVIELPQETDAPAESEAAQTAPVETEAVETEPVETEPVETEPVETEPVETEPVETEPVETEPVETEPVETEPVETEPEEAPLFPGLPEDYVLTEDALAEKARLAEQNILEKLSAMTPDLDYVEGQITVAAASEEDAAIIAAAFGGELLMYSHGYALIQLLDATVLEAMEAIVDPEQNLPAAEPSYCFTQDPIEVTSYAPYANELPREQSWYSWVRENMANPDPALENPRGSNYQWMHDAVDTYAAWGVTTGDPWVKVAVLDTGVNSSHEDLSGRVENINVVLSNGTSLGTSDIKGHGTHVAGIIGASMNNGKGGAGIAPGVTILNVRVFDKNGSCNDWYISEGIYAAVAKGAHIINMSLGGPGCSSMLQDAIDYAVACDVTVIAAMGNVGSNSMDYPAACAGVIAVAATDQSNSRAFFSNYGAWADVSAPGQGIYSTYGSSYKSDSGTSMASPVVAGVAALYTSAMGERVDPAVMEKALKASATKVAGATGMGAGIVSASKMLDDKPDAPVAYICDEVYEYNPKGLLPAESVLFLFESEAALKAFGNNGEFVGDQSSVIIYTTDGKNPSVKNGEVVNGQVLQDPMAIPLLQFAGTNVTIKAARVSGMGMVGKTLTLNLKVDSSSNVTGVTVTGPKEMAAGKTATFYATVQPADTADQSVTWSISSYGSLYGAKIDAKTGKLSTPSGKSGSITVRATSNANTRYYKDFTVSVKYIEPVARVALSKTTYEHYVGWTTTLTATFYNASGRSVSTSLAGVKWTSSDPKIATVDQNGKVTCVSKGNATITCQALDGSNKKATCKVTVKQQVTSISVNGPYTLAPGSTGTYQATVAPKNATFQKVLWNVISGPSGTTISSSGKLSVPRNARIGSTITIQAVAQDTLSVRQYVEFTITVYDKCSAVYIGCFEKHDTTGYAPGPQFGKVLMAEQDPSLGDLKNVKSITLFSVDLKHGTSDKDKQPDNAVQLTSVYGYIPGKNVKPVIVWTSSDPSVAEVNYLTGYVVAHKAGTAKITASALDGSGKKASVTLKVNNPASTISISTSAPRMLSNVPYLAFGKTATNKAVFSDTYGKPTDQKVNWRFSIYELDIYGNRVNANYDWTGYFQRNKLVTLSNGKLSVSKNVLKEWAKIDGDFQVNVYASAADGSGASGYIAYKLIPPTTKMEPTQKTFYINAGETSHKSGNLDTFAYFTSDQWPYLGASFTATSSNPGVVSLYEDSSFPSIYCCDSERGLYRVNLAGIQRGTAKITVTAADGSNKSCSFTVVVK